MYKLSVYNSLSFDPWFNLALEEKLFNEVNKEEIILYLWQNKRTVVIGKNQNPWAECNFAKLEEDGGKLARRLSGGGAVYHDIGNLNFTFIMNEDDYDVKKQLGIIIDAVNGFGLNSVFSGRNDILVDNKKFSGNAFYTNKGKKYHHGTLLVDVDMKKLGYYLSPNKKKIESKGVKSVRSRVVNLKELNPDITISNLKQALIKSFSNMYKEDVSKYTDIDENLDLKYLYEKYSSHEFRFGQSPKFDIRLFEKFEFAQIELLISVKNGIIDKIKVYTDSMSTTFAKDLESALHHAEFNALKMVDRIRNIKNFDETVLKEISNWIVSSQI